jgi:hypothetical protein
MTGSFDSTNDGLVTSTSKTPLLILHQLANFAGCTLVYMSGSGEHKAQQTCQATTRFATAACAHGQVSKRQPTTRTHTQNSARWCRMSRNKKRPAMPLALPLVAWL